MKNSVDAPVCCLWTTYGATQFVAVNGGYASNQKATSSVYLPCYPQGSQHMAALFAVRFNEEISLEGSV